MWEPFLLQIMKEVLIDLRSGAKNSAFLLHFQILCSYSQSGYDKIVQCKTGAYGLCCNKIF
jgi:hypothetical protein